MKNSGKIVSMPGHSLNPKTFCAMLMEDAENIEVIACVVKRRNEDGKTNTTVHHTQMNHGDVAWLRYVFDQDFHCESDDSEQ